MVKIGLFCAAGFSTGMLVNNMKIAAAEKGLEAEIEAQVLSTPSVKGIHQLRTRSIGRCYAIELCILVDGSISVTSGHDITLAIEQELRERYGDHTYITIHVEPAL